MTKAIIDITRAYSGTERKLVAGVLEQDSALFTRRPTVVGFDGQKGALGGDSGMVEFHSAGPWLAEPGISRLIADLVKTSMASESQLRCRVYSFHSSILAKQGDLAQFDGRLDAVPLRVYSNFMQNVMIEWPHELMPLDAALDVLVKALDSIGATASTPVRKTDIRQLLILRDRRFSKQEHPAAAQPGLITVLLGKAVEQGLIQTSGTEPRVQVFRTPRANGAGELADAQQIVSARAELVTSPDALNITANLETEGEGRSKLFQTILRRTDFGIFPEVRKEFYSHMLKIAEESGPEPLTARELTRGAVARTREGAPAVFPGRKKGDLAKEKYAWKKLEEFGMRALARTGLLRGQDSEITPDVPWLIPDSRVVTPLPENLALRLDAEMILEIIRNCQNVGWADRTDLAGAILNGRSEELTDRIEEMIRLLMAEQKVDWDEESAVLRVRASSQAAAGVGATPEEAGL